MLKRKRLIILIIVGVLAVLAVFFILKIRRGMAALKASMSAAQTVTAEKGSLSETVEGSGNIEVADTVDVKAPTGLTISEVLVESGDTVTNGQVLANIDETSIVSALVSVEDSLEAIEDRLDNDEDLTSLDKEELADKKAKLKEIQTTLEAYKEDPTIKANADGVIGDVNVEEDGTTAKTSGTGSSSSSSSSSSSTSAAAAALASYTAADNETGTATTEKAVADTTEESASVTALGGVSVLKDGNGKVTVNVAAMSGGNATGIIAGTASNTVTGTSADNTTSTGTDGAGVATDATAGNDTGIMLLTSAASGDGSGDESTEELTAITDFSALAGIKPVTGQTMPVTLTSTASESGAVIYDGAISWSPDSTKEQGGTFLGDTVYIATVTLTAGDGYEFTSDSVTALTTAMAQISTGCEITEGTSSKLVFAVTFERTESSATPTPTPTPSDTPTPSVTPTTSTSGEVSSYSDVLNGMGLGSSSSGSYSLGSSGYSTSASTTYDTSNLYNSYMMTAFTVQTQDSVKLVISIDELDINSVSEGQEAEVTFDAISDETFSGTITKVADTAKSGSSGAKYEVDVTFAKTDEMKIGMSATAVITVNKVTDAITIPMTALQEKGGENFVYTTQEEDGTLGGEVTVETGLSDGTNVEITSGLKEGDTVYYSRGTATTAEELMQQMTQGGMNNGGGDMPQGDAPDGGEGGGPGGNGGGEAPSRE